MKDSENIYVAVVLYEICDSVMPVEQYAHVAMRSYIANRFRGIP